MAEEKDFEGPGDEGGDVDGGGGKRGVSAAAAAPAAVIVSSLFVFSVFLKLLAAFGVWRMA